MQLFVLLWSGSKNDWCAEMSPYLKPHRETNMKLDWKKWCNITSVTFYMYIWWKWCNIRSKTSYLFTAYWKSFNISVGFVVSLGCFKFCIIKWKSIFFKCEKIFWWFNCVLLFWSLCPEVFLWSPAAVKRSHRDETAVLFCLSGLRV